MPTVSITLTAVTIAASAAEMDESLTTDDDESVSPHPPSRKAARRASAAAAATEMEESSTTDNDKSVSPPHQPPSRHAVRRAAAATGSSRAGQSRTAAAAPSRAVSPRTPSQSQKATRAAPSSQSGSAARPILLEQDIEESDTTNSDALTPEVVYVSEAETSTNVPVPKVSKANQHFESIKAGKKKTPTYHDINFIESMFR